METGYQVLSKQANPGVSLLQAARKDLAAEYEGMDQEAANYRAEHTAEANKAASSNGR